METTIELTPDQLAQLVAAVFKTNGFDAYGLSLFMDGQLVGFDRVIVHCHQMAEINVYPKPRQSMTREEINELLYPNVDTGSAKLSGSRVAAT